MKKCLQAIIIISSLCLSNLSAADGKKRVLIENIKYSFPITFDDTTKIREIKNSIEDAEGVPVDMQKLYKPEWVRSGWIIPEKTFIELEDEKTCADYDIQNKTVLKLWLKQRISQR